MSKYINVGCGMSPTPGWTNFDNSWSIRIARIAILVSMMQKLKLLDASQIKYIKFAIQNKIHWADAVTKLPLADASVDVLYTSHMLEHLERSKVDSFLSEAKRVLKSGGIIRICVPDLRIIIDRYIKNNDADEFIHKLHMNKNYPNSLLQKFKYLCIGDRHHQWNYDAASLSNLLNKSGFQNPVSLDAGMTTIPDPGELNLREREEESLYIEARKA